MLSAIDLMCKVYDIPGWQHLMHDKQLIKEMEDYTGLEANIPLGTTVTPDMLPEFVIE